MNLLEHYSDEEQAFFRALKTGEGRVEFGRTRDDAATRMQIIARNLGLPFRFEATEIGPGRFDVRRVL